MTDPDALEPVEIEVPAVGGGICVYGLTGVYIVGGGCPTNWLGLASCRK